LIFELRSPSNSASSIATRALLPGATGDLVLDLNAIFDADE
jgi:hypothetical protein